MNPVDRMIGAVFPRWGFRRAQYRAAMAAYEGAKPGRLRKDKPDNSNGDALTAAAGTHLRGYARQLEQNHDLARGVLTTMVNNIVGPTGISIEPQPKSRNGDLHEDFSQQLLAVWADWSIAPEVTWEHDWAAAERLICRTWLRDGEGLIQLLEGRVPLLDHGTRVPFSLELIEADLLPMGLDDDARGITQGVERNSWGRPRAYHVYKSHPGGPSLNFDFQTKRVPAEKMLHPKLVDRFRQARGVSVFASILRRLEDLKDYEESERVAARVAAAMTGYIKKGTPDLYVPPESGQANRSFSMKPGMVFDGLRAGEEIGTAQSNRPSSLLEPFRNAMVRAIAAGTGASYSSTSKDYNGTYSAQRQELVESWGNYQALTGLHVGMVTRPVWRRFVSLAIASGAVKPPRDVDMETVLDADFRGPAMPWIDPVKEAQAKKEQERAGYKSAQQIIREAGGNPKDVMRQIKQWRDQADQQGLVFTSDPKHEGARNG